MSTSAHVAHKPTTLYKRTASNILYFWKIYPDNTSYTIEWGMEGTNKPQSTTVSCGSRQRMVSEMRSRISEQVERKGYTYHIPDHVPQLPMLAQKWEDHRSKVINGTREPFPAIAIQPKLNGLRCIATSKSIVSRRNDTITSLPNISRVLRHLPPGVTLDGELYIHGVPLQMLQSYVRRDVPHSLHHTVEYHVFDMISDKPFYRRFEDLSFYIQSLAGQFLDYQNELAALNSYINLDSMITNFPIKIVPTDFSSQECSHPLSLSLISEKFKYYRNRNFEGLIIRNPESEYELNYRSPNLLKYKEVMDGEFEIVDVVEVTGKCGLFVCRVPANPDIPDDKPKIFECNPAWTTEAKRRLLRNRESYIGKWLHVQYETLSMNGIPLKPIGKLTYDHPDARH